MGVYSNYALIMGSLKGLLMTASNSITSSIGNVAAEKNREKSYLLFRTLNLLSIILYGVCAITIYIMINPFMEIWIGDQYLLSRLTVLVLCINFYIFGSQNSLASFRNAYGLFWEGKVRPLVMTLLNLVMSLSLVGSLGLAGILIGTIISRLLSVGIIDSYVIYKNVFEEKVWKYHLMKAKHGLIVFLIGAGLNYILAFMEASSIIYWLLKAMLVGLISMVALLVVFWSSEEIKYFKRITLALLKSRKGK